MLSVHSAKEVCVPERVSNQVCEVQGSELENSEPPVLWKSPDTPCV